MELFNFPIGAPYVETKKTTCIKKTKQDRLLIDRALKTYRRASFRDRKERYPYEFVCMHGSFFDSQRCTVWRDRRGVTVILRDPDDNLVASYKVSPSDRLVRIH